MKAKKKLRRLKKRMELIAVLLDVVGQASSGHLLIKDLKQIARSDARKKKKIKKHLKKLDDCGFSGGGASSSSSGGASSSSSSERRHGGTRSAARDSHADDVGRGAGEEWTRDPNGRSNLCG